MKYKFCDLVDVEKLHNLLEGLYQATGIPSAVTDVEGNILVAVGWQEICLRFHRQNFYTEKLCRQSDTYIKQHLADTKPYLCYKCANGLMDAAAPIIIDGVCVASVFLGQFFFEEPDSNYFVRQAERYHYDKEDYLAALAKVPIYTPEKLDSIMRYYIELAKVLADLGMARLCQIEQQAQELQRGDEQICKIFNSTPNVAIQRYDEYGNITFFNNAAEQMYGFKEAEVIGKSLHMTIFGNREAEKFLNILKEVGVSNLLYGPVEWKMRHKSGNEIYVYSTLFPIILSNGKKEFVCMDVDITEQKHLAEELQRLDKLNLIGEMAASLGHEIRNPMTTVRGYLQMLRIKHCYPEHVRQFDLMIEELDRANQIISEFLSLARNKPINKNTFDLNQIIDNLMLLLSADAIKENKVIRWTQGAIQTLLLDENEMRQLIINLIRNALEATEQGGKISICTFMDKGAVVLKVQDSGKGIPKDLLDKIGTPFITTKTGGTGLGLAVCFSIAARHNAQIMIESNSAGTSIFVKFPGADRDWEGDERKELQGNCS